jgi:hypothetical protein
MIFSNSICQLMVKLDMITWVICDRLEHFIVILLNNMQILSCLLITKINVLRKTSLFSFSALQTDYSYPYFWWSLLHISCKFNELSKSLVLVSSNYVKLADGNLWLCCLKCSTLTESYTILSINLLLNVDSTSHKYRNLLKHLMDYYQLLSWGVLILGITHHLSYIYGIHCLCWKASWSN